MATSPQPIDIASAIADLTPIDWASLERQTVHAADRAMLSRLRLLDRIVRACAPTSQTDRTSGAQTNDEPPPASWGPFDLHERVGRGAFGDVYRAHDRRLDRVVALKLLKPERNRATTTIESEAIHEGRLLAKVRHPNVVTVYGAERIDGRVGVWMEFIDGRTLEEELRQSGPFAAEEVVRIGIALCDALVAVHQAGLLHRDLKAQNVMRANDGRLLLTDFGAGRVVDNSVDEVTAREGLAGTPLYLAPEALDGAAASPKTEVYAIGVLLYHLATGSFPVRGKSVRDLKRAHAAGERVSIRAYRGKVPAAVVAVIDRAIHPDPARRFSTVQQLSSALTGITSRRFTRWAVTATASVLFLAAATNWIIDRHFPLQVVSMTKLIDSRAGDMSVAFWTNGRLYFNVNGTLESVNPDHPGDRQTHNDQSSSFKVVDMHPTADRKEFLALKATGGDVEELWAISDGQPRPLSDAHCSGARWSRDGHHIACAAARELFVRRDDGRPERQLPVPAGVAIVWPQWSPDNTRLVFNVQKREPSSEDLWEIRADGTGLRRILPEWSWPGAEAPAVWTADGRELIIRSFRNQHGSFWAVADRAGWLDWRSEEPRRLTDESISFDGAPVVGDGNVLYASARARDARLLAFNADKKTFEAAHGGIAGTWVARSPDQRSIAYISYPDKQLWRANADGSLPRPLVKAGLELDGSMWSPDGQWISFIGRLQGQQRKIFLIRPDRFDKPDPITDKDVVQGIPSWSADSKQFCYGDVPPFGQPRGDEVLHLYDVTTKQTTTVPGSEGLYTCRWSPDGRFLAALTIDAGPTSMKLNVYDVETQKWRALPDAHHVNDPNWSHDSQFIYYDTEGMQTVRLRRVRVSTGAVEELVALSEFTTSHWSGLTADDRPLILGESGPAGIFAIKLGRRWAW